MKIEKIIISILFIMIFVVSLYGKGNWLKPLEIDSFPEFFEKVHIGMKSEDVIKALDGRFKLIPADSEAIGYKDLNLFWNDDFVDILYNKIKYSTSFLFYKDILFQIRSFKDLSIYKDKTRGEKTEYSDYENIINDFKNDSKYIYLLEEKFKPIDQSGYRSSVTVNMCHFKIDDKVITIKFVEEIYNDNIKNLQKYYMLSIFQFPFIIYEDIKNSESDKKYEVLEQFVNSYLKQ